MSSLGLLWLLLYAVGCVATLANPLYGLVTYLFTYYSNPPLHWWGEGLPLLRWSYTISLITLASFFIHRAGHGAPGFFSHPPARWLAALAILSALVTPFAIDPTESARYRDNFAKFLVLYYLFAKMVRSYSSYRLLVLVHVLGGLFWGLEAFLDPHTEDGRLVNIGGPDSDGSNATAAHILTILPFIGYYVLAGGGWERWLCLAAAPFILRALVMLNSRGSMLALAVTGLVSLVVGRRYFWRSLVAMGVAATVLFTVGGEVFMRRQSTVMTYEEDYSATSRLEMWQAALRMVKDHPLGVGGQGYDLLSPRYLPDMVEKRDVEQTVHNTYLMAAAEWGILGGILFLGFLFAIFLELHRVRGRLPDTAFGRRLHLETLAVEVALVGVLVAGLFINRLYAEVIYWLAGLTAALANIAAGEQQEVAAPTVDELPQAAAAGAR